MYTMTLHASLMMLDPVAKWTLDIHSNTNQVTYVAGKGGSTQDIVVKG